MRAGRFDAAFLAVGAHIAKRAYIPAGESAKILDAVSMLRSMEGEDKPLLGRRVVVYGGGNTSVCPVGCGKPVSSNASRSTITRVDEGRMVVEGMDLDETGFPQPTGQTEV